MVGGGYRLVILQDDAGQIKYVSVGSKEREKKIRKILQKHKKKLWHFKSFFQVAF